MTLPTSDPGFSTEALTLAFGPIARVAAMCRFEAGLARASGRVGAVDAEAAERAARRCDDGVTDPEVVLEEGWEAGTPVLPLLARLRADLDDEAADVLHHGATTQDVVDSATMLQVRVALDALRDDVRHVAAGLRDVATTHRDTPARAWTFLQPAVPTTVGHRAAGWLAPLVAQLRDLRDQRASLPVQLGGPTGTLAALGDHGPAVVEAIAGELDLVAPVAPWHTDRRPVVRVVDVVTGTAAALAKVAGDVALLAHQGEVVVRAGGSSSMPGKRNPVDAVRALAAARACAAAATAVRAAGPHELERAVGTWHAEWWALPQVLQCAGAAAEGVRRLVETFEVGDVAPPEAGPTPTTGTVVDRVVAACDDELGS